MRRRSFATCVTRQGRWWWAVWPEVRFEDEPIAHGTAPTERQALDKARAIASADGCAPYELKSRIARARRVDICGDRRRLQKGVRS